MPRLMSVSYTEAAVVARTKTVTRRKGWTFLKPGDRLTLCRKVMGRKPGEPLVRLAEVEVIDVRREQLSDLAWATPFTVDYRWAKDEVSREGFPDLEPTEFVRGFFLNAQGMNVSDMVTRIQWRYLDGGAS